jgi:site-specific recombinase XerD
VNTKPSCFRNGSYPRTRWHNPQSVLRFFYIKTLNKAWSIAETPYPNRTHRLPTIVSQQDVAQLIDAALTPFHHTVLMTLYGSGVRNAELTRLKATDSPGMVIHLRDYQSRCSGRSGRVCNLILFPTQEAS